MKEGAKLYLSVSTRGSFATGSCNGKSTTGGHANLKTSKKYLDMWLDHGKSAVTLTYHKGTDSWSDSFGGTGSWGDYNLSARYYASAGAQLD